MPPISTISLYPVDLGGFVNSYNMIEQVIMVFKNWTLVFEYQKLTKVGSSISLLESLLEYVGQKVDHTNLAWKVLSTQFEHHLCLERLFGVQFSNDSPKVGLTHEEFRFLNI